MSLALPTPVAAYFAADKVDGQAVAQCFAEDAIVKDEGHTYHGRAAIQQWKEQASAQYQYTCAPLACDDNAGKSVVTCRLVGNFPGSPVDLRFAFELTGEQIVSLEIAP